MKRPFILICFCIGLQTVCQTKESPAQASAQQKLEQTCQSIKSGKADPQMADVCRAFELEKEKKIEQGKEDMRFWAAKYCGAKWAPGSAQRAQWVRVKENMMPTFARQSHGHGITFLIVDSPVINSWTVVGQRMSYICMPTKMIDFLSSDGQIAFVMGHEMGHAVDPACKGINRNDLAVRRACESRADAVGFDLLFKSGFSPFDVGAAFGKLEMYSGDINTDKGAREAALARDHPMTPDRIAHMRQMLSQYNAVISGPLGH